MKDMDNLSINDKNKHSIYDQDTLNTKTQNQKIGDNRNPEDINNLLSNNDRYKVK